MLSANGPAGRRSGGGLRLDPGVEGSGLVRDDAVDARIGEASPVGGCVGGPGPELQAMVTGGIRGVWPDDRVEEGDGADSVCRSSRTEGLESGAAHRRDDESRVDLGSEGAGPLHEVVVEGVEGSPGLGAMAAYDVEGGIEEGGALLGVVGSDLHLAHDGDAAGDEVEDLVERGDGLPLAGVGGGEVREGHVGDGAREVRRTVEGVVVEEDGDTVGAEVEVDLHGGGAREGGAHAREGVCRGLARGSGVGDDDGRAHGAREDTPPACETVRMADECVFCAIVAGTEPASVVWEDSLAMAFMDLRQPNPGHVLVVPRAHIADILELDDHTGAALMAGTTRVARGVARAFAPDGLNVWQSTGEAAGQEVFHLHLHVMPRQTGDTLFRPYTELPPPTPRATLDALAEELRGQLPEEA